MARPLRITSLRAFYHVTSRGNERKAVFITRNAFWKPTSDYATHQWRLYNLFQCKACEVRSPIPGIRKGGF